MPGVSSDKLLLLLKTTIDNYTSDPNDFEQTFSKQRYIAVDDWFTNGKRKEAEGGPNYVRHVVLNPTGRATHLLPYESKQIAVKGSIDQITVPFTLIDNDWVTNRDEMNRNRGSVQQVINMVKVRREECYKEIAETLEERCFSAPDSATDVRNPLGLRYWISMLEQNATAAGFNAYRVRYGDGASSTNATTTKGGIDGSLANKSMWRNYAATYEGVNEDFIKAVDRLMTLMRFRAPRVKELAGRTQVDIAPSNFSIYAGIDEHNEMLQLARANNDNYGPSLSPYDTPMFRRIEVEHAPVLDSAAYDPVYFVNHNHFYPVVLAGEWLVEDGPMRVSAEQHRTFVTKVNGSYQIMCDNVRHGGAVLHKVVTG